MRNAPDKDERYWKAMWRDKEVYIKDLSRILNGYGYESEQYLFWKGLFALIQSYVDIKESNPEQ